MEEKFGIGTKKLMVEEMKEKLSSSPNLFITNYKGLSSLEIEKLRRELVKASSKYFVVKNSLVKRAFDQLDLKDLSQFIKGEVGISPSCDAIGTSKALVGFSKAYSSFKINCAFIDGKIEGTDRIKELAALPPREVLLSLVFSYMKSPITGFVGVLKSLLRNLVYAINEIKDKKGGEKNG